MLDDLDTLHRWQHEAEVVQWWGEPTEDREEFRADYFGGTNFGAIIGTSSMIAAFGTTAGPLIAGILADRTGNYESGFTLLAVMAALGSIFSSSRARRRRRRTPRASMSLRWRRLPRANRLRR